MRIFTNTMAFKENKVIIHDIESKGSSLLVDINFRGICQSLSTGEKEALGFALTKKLKDLLKHRVDGKIIVVKPD